MHERFRTIRSNGALWWSKRSRAQKIACVIVFIVVLVTIFRHRDPLSGATIDTAKVQTLEKTVRASGTVTSATDLNLSFQTADLVTSVKVRVGDKVKKGQVLATLASNEETATLTKANAVLLSAQAAYTKVLEGASDEEVRVAQVAYDSAVTVQNNLVENARRNLYSDDLVAIPKGITSATSPTPIISGTYNGATPGSYYLRFGASLNTVIVRGLESDEFSRDTDPSSMGVLGLRVFFPDGGYGTNDNWEIVIPNTDGAHYTTNLNAYNTALSNRDAAIAQAQATLDLKKATARKPDVDAAYAAVLSAQGDRDLAAANYEKKIIRAPADGTITRVDIKIGDQPTVGTPVIVLQDVDNLYVEASINESNISDIVLGQPIDVTYDAFGSDKHFAATVSSIDLSPTIEDGIVNYKIKALITDTTQIKSGMTANLSVLIASKPQVVVIPARMITSVDGQKTVEVLVNERRGSHVSRTVTVGLVGDGGLTEIVSGLASGERVVSFSK